MFTPLVLVLHLLACGVLVLVVLLQTGKGASLGAAFGGASQTVFGASGAGNVLTKITTGMAILFMLTSLALATMGGNTQSDSIMQSAPAASQEEAAPATGATDATAPAAEEAKSE